MPTPFGIHRHICVSEYFLNGTSAQYPHKKGDIVEIEKTKTNKILSNYMSMITE